MVPAAVLKTSSKDGKQMETVAVERNGHRALDFAHMPRTTPEERENMVRVAVRFAGGPVACADKMGVSRQVIAKWIAAEEKERGSFKDVAYKYVMALADASGIPPWELTGIAPFVPGGLRRNERGKST
jgi:transposase-like protein